MEPDRGSGTLVECVLSEGDKSCSQGKRCTRSIFVCCGLFLFLIEEEALSRFKHWCNESIERQRLKAEKREIIQQIFLRHLLCAWWCFRHRGHSKDKDLWTLPSCEWIINGAASS